MKLLGITISYNEEKVIPYVMPYYERLGLDKLVVFDNRSTDRTRELLSQYPFVEIRDYDTGGIFSETGNANIKNHAWKEFADDYDWCICADFDEVVWTRRPIRDILKEQEESGGTIMRKIMLNIVTPVFPDTSDGRLIHEITGRGTPWYGMVGAPEDSGIWGYKPMFFNLRKITEMNGCVGAHNCEPVGEVSYFETPDFEVLHLKYIDFNYLFHKSKGYADRYNKEELSSGDRYNLLSEYNKLAETFYNLSRGSVEILP